MKFSGNQYFIFEYNKNNFIKRNIKRIVVSIVSSIWGGG